MGLFSSKSRKRKRKHAVIAALDELEAQKTKAAEKAEREEASQYSLLADRALSRKVALFRVKVFKEGGYNDNGLEKGGFFNNGAKTETGLVNLFDELP